MSYTLRKLETKEIDPFLPEPCKHSLNRNANVS